MSSRIACNRPRTSLACTAIVLLGGCGSGGSRGGMVPRPPGRDRARGLHYFIVVLRYNGGGLVPDGT